HHEKRLVTTALSGRLQRLFELCAARGYSVIIPETTLLEFNRHQIHELERTRSEIRSAFETLDKFNIPHAPYDPDIVQLPDLLTLIRASGINAILEKATFDDLTEAHH